MTISRSKAAPARYKVVVGGWTLIVYQSSLHRAIEAVVVILASISLFLAGQAHGLQERGYEAIGGEYLLLALPVLYYLLRAVIKDYLADLREIRNKAALQSWERYEITRGLTVAARPINRSMEWWVRTPPTKEERVPDDGRIYPPPTHDPQEETIK